MATLENPDKINIIFKRDFERKLNIQKQKDQKESNNAENERIESFEKEFLFKCNEIEKILDLSSNLSLNKLPDHFNRIFKDLLLLQKYVADSNLFLRTYDIKKCNEILYTLSNKTKKYEDELLPKKKFGFKNKLKNLNKTENSNEKSRDEPDFPQNNQKLSSNLDSDNSTGFSNRISETLSLQENETFKKDVSIYNMADCIVRIFGTPSTLHLNNLKGCTIMSGPVSTSIFASNCENCTFVIACQQLRLHVSKEIQIYLQVTSRAIIEDCSNIYVAPYNFKYNGIDKHFESSSLDKNINNWQDIDDFNWLKTNEKSPNWKVLHEKERKEFWY